MSSVALLSPCYWPEVRRGGERFTRELADGLLSHGFAPTLITSHPGWPSRRDEDGLRVLRLPRPPQGFLLRRGYDQYLTHVVESYAALRVGHFGLAHAMYPSDALAAARWRARTGRPALLSYLGIPDGPGLDERRWHRELVGRAVTGLDRVVALSEFAAAAFRDSFGYDAPVIAPGVDVEVFRPRGHRASVPTIICAADASQPRKHVALLIEAFDLLRAELPDACLMLSAPKALPSPEAVIWCDLDDRDTLASMYARATVAVLPSASEAFGLVLAEALACGTPVVGYADGAIPEVVNSRAIGRLFSELNARALAEALLEAVELAVDPATASACRARGLEFSRARCVDAYLRVYAELGVHPPSG